MAPDRSKMSARLVRLPLCVAAIAEEDELKARAGPTWMTDRDKADEPAAPVLQVGAVQRGEFLVGHRVLPQGQQHARGVDPVRVQRQGRLDEAETSLRQALQRNEFSLHYQAKLDLKSGGISGVEALLRWLPVVVEGDAVRAGAIIHRPFENVRSDTQTGDVGATRCAGRAG